MIVHSVYNFYNILCTITSCNDSKHGAGSLHPYGRAFDVRTKNIEALTGSSNATARKQDIVRICREQLGPQFDVVLEDLGGENEHMHVEWDPKTLKVTT